jgi:hypothetical protein
MKFHTYYPLLAVITLVMLSAAAFGQLSNDLQRTTDFVNNSQPKTSNDHIRLMEQIVNNLRPHAKTDDDVRVLIQTLETTKDLLRYEADSLISNTNRAQAATNAVERSQRLDALRAALLERAATLVQYLAQPNMSVQDAKRISDIAKYASQALDDIKDPSILGGASSSYTKLFTRLAGIASLSQAVQNPEARSILSGLRGTLGTVDKKLKVLGVSAGNPMKAFDIPAEVAGAVIQNSSKAMDQASAALEDVSRAMDGDTAALKRLSEHSQRIQSTLSPKTYGQAMFNALTERVVDRIPFVRTLAKLFGPTPPSGVISNGGPSKVVEVWWNESAKGTNEDDLYSCAPNPERKGIYGGIEGSDRYSLFMSRLCLAAVHAGAITFERGGRFQVRLFPVDKDFQPVASMRNGVTSGDYNARGFGSFVVLRVD